MKIKNWIACNQDRGKWKEVVEKAKTFNQEVQCLEEEVTYPRCVGYNYKDRQSESNTTYECIILFTSCSLEVTSKLHLVNKIIHS